MRWNLWVLLSFCPLDNPPRFRRSFRVANHVDNEGFGTTSLIDGPPGGRISAKLL
jgi:hypothetical protein